MTRDDERKLSDALKPFGATYSVERTHKQHEKVLIECNGQRRIVIKSATPQCSRAFKNFIGDVKRAAKGLVNGAM